MGHHPVDITLLTDGRYVNPPTVDWYIGNILEEDRLVRQALEKRGLYVARTNWDNPDYDWTNTRFILFRTTWDYFNRFDEFMDWLNAVNSQTKLINPLELIRWNLDKQYLRDLQQRGVRIPPTLFIQPNEQRSLRQLVEKSGWHECILKPAVSGAARHTYRLTPENVAEHEAVFRTLISKETMLLQEFQQPVLSHGEVAYMIFGGTFTHAVLKKARPGDFRVQDDFGGTVHQYNPTADEISFAERAVKLCDPLPSYARVDVIRDNQMQLCVSELELIEPELWFRNKPSAADQFAAAIAAEIKKYSRP